MGRPARRPVICFTFFEYQASTTLREKLIKIGAKIVRRARYATFQWAEVAIPRKLFRDILRRIERLKSRSVSLDSGRVDAWKSPSIMNQLRSASARNLDVGAKLNHQKSIHDEKYRNSPKYRLRWLVRNAVAVRQRRRNVHLGNLG